MHVEENLTGCSDSESCKLEVIALETGSSRDYVPAVQAESSEALSQPWQLLLLVKASLILFLALCWLFGST